MSARNNCHVWYSVMRGSVNDSFSCRTIATNQVKEACLSLFKCTPDQMVLHVEAFITGGLAGTIKLAGKGQSAKMQGEIRELILEGLRESIIARKLFETLTFVGQRILLNRNMNVMVHWTRMSPLA